MRRLAVPNDARMLQRGSLRSWVRRRKAACALAERAEALRFAKGRIGAKRLLRFRGSLLVGGLGFRPALESGQGLGAPEERFRAFR